ALLGRQVAEQVFVQKLGEFTAVHASLVGCCWTEPPAVWMHRIGRGYTPVRIPRMVNLFSRTVNPLFQRVLNLPWTDDFRRIYLSLGNVVYRRRNVGAPADAGRARQCI